MVTRAPSTCSRRERRISDDIPAPTVYIRRAQKAIDTDERLKQAYHVSIHDKKNFMSPARVKGLVKTFLNGTSGRTVTTKKELCSAMNVTEEELNFFLGERKQKGMLGSKGFHSALASIHKRSKEQQTQTGEKRPVVEQRSSPSSTSTLENSARESSSGSSIEEVPPQLEQSQSTSGRKRSRPTEDS